MARIRHIAIVVEDSEKSAAFYMAAFGLKEVFRNKNNDTQGQWSIFLTDGYINLALLPIKQPLGVHHFGFAVDDVEVAMDQALAAGALPPAYALPRDGRQAETFVTDPLLGTKLDISRGWITERPAGPARMDTSTPVPAG
jgi:catechol 2,3-dioxygenase-like lactoylglutathione lyase family enzyme